MSYVTSVRVLARIGGATTPGGNPVILTPTAITAPAARYRAAMEALSPIVYFPMQGRYEDGVKATDGTPATLMGRVYPNDSWLDEVDEPPTELGRYLTTYLHQDDQDAGLSMASHLGKLTTMAKSRQWTHTAWVRPEGTGYKQAIMVLNGSDGGHISLHWQSNGQGIWAEDGNGHVVDGPTTFSTVGRWSMVAMTVSGQTVALYVDGVQVGSGQLDAWPSSATVTSAYLLSMNRAGGANCTFGSATHFALFPATLTGAQLADLNAKGRHVATSGADPAYWLPWTGEDANFGGTQAYFTWPHEVNLRNPDYPRMGGWWSSAGLDKPANLAEQKKSHAIAIHGNSANTRLADFVTGGFTAWPDYAALFPEVAAEEARVSGMDPVSPFLDAANPPAEGWDLITVSDEWDTFEPRMVDGVLTEQWQLKKAAVEKYTAITGRRAFVNEGVGVTFGAHDRHTERKFFAGIKGYASASCDMYVQCSDFDMGTEMQAHGFPHASLKQFRHPDMYSRFPKRLRGMLDRPMVVYGAVANGHANLQRSKGPKSAPTPREYEASCIASYLGGATGILVFPESYASEPDDATAQWGAGKAYAFNDQVRRDADGQVTYWCALTDVPAGVDPATDTPNLHWVRWRPTGSGDTSNPDAHAIGMPEASQRAFRVQAAKSKVLQADGRYRVQAHPDLSALAVDAVDGRAHLVVLQRFYRESGTYTIQLPASAAGKTITVEHMCGTDATATLTADANARITETFTDRCDFFWYSWTSNGVTVTTTPSDGTAQPSDTGTTTPSAGAGGVKPLGKVIVLGDSLTQYPGDPNERGYVSPTFIADRFKAAGASDAYVYGIAGHQILQPADQSQPTTTAMIDKASTDAGFAPDTVVIRLGQNANFEAESWQSLDSTGRASYIPQVTLQDAKTVISKVQQTWPNARILWVNMADEWAIGNVSNWPNNGLSWGQIVAKGNAGELSYAPRANAAIAQAMAPLGDKGEVMDFWDWFGRTHPQGWAFGATSTAWFDAADGTHPNAAGAWATWQHIAEAAAATIWS